MTGCGANRRTSSTVEIETRAVPLRGPCRSPWYIIFCLHGPDVTLGGFGAVDFVCFGVKILRFLVPVQTPSVETVEYHHGYRGRDVFVCSLPLQYLYLQDNVARSSQAFGGAVCTKSIYDVNIETAVVGCDRSE